MNALFLALTEPELPEKAFRAVGGLFLFAIALAIMILVVAWIVFPLLISGRIGEVLKELRGQTALLEQIAKNTRKPEDLPKPAPSLSYMREEPKMAIGWVLAAVAVVGAVIFVIVMAQN